MAFLNVDVPPINFNNVAYGSFAVEGHSESNLNSNLRISTSLSLQASYTIKPHNVAYGSFELVAPPRINRTLLPIMDSYVRNDARTMNFDSRDLIISNDNDGIYRSFLKFDLSLLQERLLFTKAILKLKPLEISDEFTIDIYKVNSYWNEKTITWSGQPIKGQYVKSFTVSPLNTNIEIELKTLIQEWYSDNYNNYGIVLQLNPENEEHKIRVGSKEIQGYEPILELEYFDPIIPQYNISVLNSYLNIPEHLTNEIPASIEIISNYETNTLQSDIHIHLPNTLESSIEIQKGNLQSDIIISNINSLLSSLNISRKTSMDLLSQISINRSELQGNIIIPNENFINAEINIVNTKALNLRGYISIDNATNGSRYMLSELNISKPTIGGKITIAQSSNLISTIRIKTVSTKDLASNIQITRNELPSDIHIEVWRQLESDVTVAINNELNADIFIPYRNQDSLSSNIFIMQNKILYANGFIRSPYLRGNITIKRNDVDTLKSKITIRDIYPYLLSEINISGQWSVDLFSSVTINGNMSGGNKAYGFIF